LFLEILLGFACDFVTTTIGEWRANAMSIDVVVDYVQEQEGEFIFVRGNLIPPNQKRRNLVVSYDLRTRRWPKGQSFLPLKPATASQPYRFIIRRHCNPYRPVRRQWKVDRLPLMMLFVFPSLLFACLDGRGIIT
jgi:hypothetical protein